MFLNFYNELTQLNEGYNIPYSGYVIINDDGNFFAGTDKVRSQLWADYYYEAAIFKTEEEALEAKYWLFRHYDEDLCCYIKYLESNKDIEKAAFEEKLFEILELWHAFVEAGTMLQKLCNENDFKNFDYTINDYKNKKPAPGLLIYNLQNNDNIEDTAKRLQEFHKEIVKASKLEDTNKELVDKTNKFAQAWHNVADAMFYCNYKYQLTELLQNNI